MAVAFLALVGTGVVAQIGPAPSLVTEPRDVLETAGVLSQPFSRVAYQTS